ncbi:alpha/beta fold hydrolase [Haliea sp. E17]|uniref:alpha/beta fold hydrolase n=1 Tax=Haliea sp. E17 TaxID=3401576 RepID=UPI003AAE96B4
MGKLRIRTLGEFAVERDGKALKLPASRRTRALLAYLAITGRPHRRDRLCELLWEIPDDPRGALRWSLSKIRPLVNDDAGERLHADRERVSLGAPDLEVDLASLAADLEAPDLAIGSLDRLLEALAEPFLDSMDLPDQSLFQAWLTAEREDIHRLRGRALRRLAVHRDLAPERVLAVARAWSASEPYSTDAATHLVSRLEQFGRASDAAAMRGELAARFQNAGIAWLPQPAAAAVPGPAAVDTPRQFLARQKIQFCTASDAVRIAYASVGEGRPIVKAANWLSHLELDWDAPIWSPLFRELARDHQVIRYDERGNGLSDWDVADLSFEAFVTDLETVVDTAGLDRFALLGISQGAAVSIEYAVRHPERVSRLILFGGYPQGWRVNASEQTIREREAVMTLTASGWGQDNPAYRQIFSSTFLPSASTDELNWFNEFQRLTTSPENAVRFLSAFGDIDVRQRLARVTVPTLVIHSLGDHRIPVATGRDIAASIPGAEFLGLESDGHLLLGREPASQVFVEAVREFVDRD